LVAMATAALQRRGLVVHGDSAAARDDAGVLATVTAGRHQASLREGARGRLQDAWPAGAAVVRNPAPPGPRQRAFHALVVRPHYVLLTNVRSDPAGWRVRPRAIEARAIVRAVTPGAILVSGEGDPALRLL